MKHYGTIFVSGMKLTNIKDSVRKTHGDISPKVKPRSPAELDRKQARDDKRAGITYDTLMPTVSCR